MTGKNSTALNHVYEIPTFWINLDGLMHSSNLNIIESYITRAYCMQGALTFHHWLLDIVQDAVKSSSRNTWIERLAADVYLALNRKSTTTFDSAEYLPNLNFHCTYSYEPQFVFDQTELIISTTSSILRLWLKFPSDQKSLLQLSLLNIVTFKSPSSVLFLDKIWEMYITPFSTVFNVWNMRISKADIDTSLDEFTHQFHSHPFTTIGSLEYQKLEYLKELIAEWMKNSGLAFDVPASSVRTLQNSLFFSLTFFLLLQLGAITRDLATMTNDSPSHSTSVSNLLYRKNQTILNTIQAL